MPHLPFNYTIRRSQRASNTRIIVSHEKVEVVAPLRVAERSIHQFVYAKQQWIIFALAKVAAKSHSAQKLASGFDGDNAQILFQGRHYSFNAQPTKLKRVQIQFSDGFNLAVPETLPIDKHHDAIKAALTQWMKNQAGIKVAQLVDIHAKRKQLYPRSIIIKTQKSRWGSCGIHNDININWLLMMAPPEVIEYVVVHELCHIQVRNHSANFWALVAEHLPGYQQQRRWLKQHGVTLMQGL